MSCTLYTLEVLRSTGSCTRSHLNEKLRFVSRSSTYCIAQRPSMLPTAKPDVDSPDAVKVAGAVELVTSSVPLAEGGNASRTNEGTVNWPALAASQGTLILLMAVERLAAVAATLIGHGRPAQTPVSVIADGTLPTQRTIVATLDTVAPRVVKDGIRPPAVVVIGEVVNVAAEIAGLVQRMPAATGPA